MSTVVVTERSEKSVGRTVGHTVVPAFGGGGLTVPFILLNPVIARARPDSWPMRQGVRIKCRIRGQSASPAAATCASH